MSDGTLRRLTAALALGGVGIASYLVVERYAGGAVACAFGGCETVQRSAYAEVLGVPVALLGLVGYLALFALTFSRSELAHAGTLTVALGAFAFSAYLLYAQVVLIGAICQWCVVSDALVTAIAATSLIRLPVRRAELSSP